MIVVETLLPDDDVPAAREGAEHEGAWPRLPEPELDPVGIEDDDLAHRGEEGSARDHHPLGRPHDPVVGRLDVLGGEVGAVVELDAPSQVEGVPLAVWRDLPALRQVGNDGLSVAGIAPDEGVVHGPLQPDIADGARLMHVEVSGGAVDAEAQGAPALDRGIGLDGGVLGGGGVRPRQPPREDGGARRARALEEAPAIDSGGRPRIGHGVTHRFLPGPRGAASSPFSSPDYSKAALRRAVVLGNASVAARDDGASPPTARSSAPRGAALPRTARPCPARTDRESGWPTAPGG